MEGGVQLVAIALTAVLGLFGFKKGNKKTASIIGIMTSVNDLILSVTDAIKPEKDGQVRIDPDEIDRIKRELGKLKNHISLL